MSLVHHQPATNIPQDTTLHKPPRQRRWLPVKQMEKMFDEELLRAVSFSATIPTSFVTFHKIVDTNLACWT